MILKQQRLVGRFEKGFYTQSQSPHSEHMSKGILFVGVALLLAGLLLLMAGFSAYGISSGDYVNWKNSDDRKEGDEVNVHGKITDERQLFGVYSYELDNNDKASFISDVDIGNVGDSVVVKVKMENMLSGISKNASALVPVAQEKVNPGTPILIGSLISLVGIIAAVVGVRK